MKENFKKLQQIGRGKESGVGMLLVRSTGAKDTKTSVALSNAGPADLEMVVGAAVVRAAELWIEAEVRAGKDRKATGKYACSQLVNAVTDAIVHFAKPQGFLPLEL